MGVTALDSHMKGAKHTACSTARQRQPPIVQFCAPQTSSVTETALAVNFYIRSIATAAKEHPILLWLDTNSAGRGDVGP